MIKIIIVVLLIAAVVGCLPSWGHSRGWGYAPSGIGGLIVFILIVLFLTGRL